MHIPVKAPVIGSIGRPHEIHADRVVAEMLRYLAAQRRDLYTEVNAAWNNSSDGSPKAQRKMEARVRKAGASHTDLTPGKRGCYTLIFYDQVGWDPARDAEIIGDDPIPEKPWIACNISILTSKGRGRGTSFKSGTLVWITHHVLSRAAQRLGVRTVEQMLVMVRVIFNEAMSFLCKHKDDDYADVLAAIPPAGHRMEIKHKEDGHTIVTLVFKRHEKRKGLVAATIFVPDE